MSGWIGVDMDGTLAYDDGDPSFSKPIGNPIQPMVKRIRHWLDCGFQVKIFTARTGFPGIEEKIHTWLKTECDLPPLEITNVKDGMCAQIWDDRAIQVIRNTGEPVT